MIADKFVDLYDLHRFAVVRRLTALEQQVIADAKSGWNKSLAERLRGISPKRHRSADHTDTRSISSISCTSGECNSCQRSQSV